MVVLLNVRRWELGTGSDVLLSLNTEIASAMHSADERISQNTVKVNKCCNKYISGGCRRGRNVSLLVRGDVQPGLQRDTWLSYDAIYTLTPLLLGKGCDREPSRSGLVRIPQRNNASGMEEGASCK